jgi:hypothetical protein
LEPLMNLRITGGFALVLFGAALPLGCGGRPAVWSQNPGGAQAFGLSNAVALHDPSAQRVVALGVASDGALTETSLPTGTDVVATAVDAQRTRLFLLSAGHRGGLGDPQPDEAPSLTIVDDGSASVTSPSVRKIDLGPVLSDPLDGLTIDPTGHWAVLYALGARGAAFVTNPNELVVVDLSPIGAKAPVAVTLHSFGGRPEKLVFAPELSLPAGKGHLLIVQSAQDLSLVSLDDPTVPEITVRLADAAAASTPRPAEIVVDDGDPAKTDDARIGVRFENDTSVMTLQLVPAPGPNGFAPVPNVTDVGGVPSALAFVRTDGGLRLAALVPALARAVLVDPATTITSDVALPTAYRSVSLVTAAAGAAATTAVGADVALLWNGTAGQAGVAFWELGQAAGRPFRSLETVAVAETVTGVLDVSGQNATSKVLSTAQGGVFYVLDLGQRTATPLLTAGSAVNLVVSSTGARVWTFAKGGTQLAATDLATKHVRTLQLDEPATDVFEIARAGGGRTLVVLHDIGGVGATLFDADNPNEDHRRLYGALLTEAP